MSLKPDDQYTIPSLHLRLDRTATLWLRRIVKHRVPKSHNRKLPILMYHSIADETSRANSYFETNTTPKVFTSHLEWLLKNRYRILSVRQAVDEIRNNAISTNVVALAFDDGYEDVYRTAFPLLAKHGASATVYAIAAYSKDSRRYFGGRPCLTAAEMCELDRNGVEIGSHTMTHPDLHVLKPDAREYEVCKSKAVIEDALGHPIVSFAYPYAFPEEDSAFVAHFRKLLVKHCYQNGVCTSIGRAHQNDDVLFLPRIPINCWDDPGLFEAKVTGSYDWLRMPQKLYKRSKQSMQRILS